MKAKEIIKGIVEGFDDNEQIENAVEWVQAAANQFAEQVDEIEKLKAAKESAADAFSRVIDALSKASPNSITSHMSGEDACMRMIDDMRWAIDQLKAENERLK